MIAPFVSGRKRSSRTISGDPANHASTSRVPEPASRAEADTGPAPHSPPTEDADMFSATNSEVESAMNHRRWRAVLRNNIFSEEAVNAFNSWMHISEQLKAGLPERWTSIPKIYG